MKQINMAIQVLPEAEGKVKYELVDSAIKTIIDSGLKYKVCPFETVVECSLERGLKLIEEIQAACKKAGTQKMLTNIKIQSDFSADVTISDKMKKYE